MYVCEEPLTRPRWPAVFFPSILFSPILPPPPFQLPSTPPSPNFLPPPHFPDSSFSPFLACILFFPPSPSPPRNTLSFTVSLPPPHTLLLFLQFTVAPVEPRASAFVLILTLPEMIVRSTPPPPPSHLHRSVFLPQTNAAGYSFFFFLTYTLRVPPRPLPTNAETAEKRASRY